MTFLYPTEGEKTKPLRLEATGRGPAVWVPPTAPRAESIAILARGASAVPWRGSSALNGPRFRGTSRATAFVKQNELTNQPVTSLPAHPQFHSHRQLPSFVLCLVVSSLRGHLSVVFQMSI